MLPQYMILICKRASGELKTAASWIRDFVHEHPEYKQDSVVSEEIAHDLVMELRAIGEVGTCLSWYFLASSFVMLMGRLA